MNDPTEADLLALIGTEESMTLEFKRGDLLDKDANKIAEELSREVSGFANAVGGRIIVGMDEEKKRKRGVAHALTGVASPAWTAHRRPRHRSPHGQCNSPPRDHPTAGCWCPIGSPKLLSIYLGCKHRLVGGN